MTEQDIYKTGNLKQSDVGDNLRIFGDIIAELKKSPLGEALIGLLQEPSKLLEALKKNQSLVIELDNFSHSELDTGEEKSANDNYSEIIEEALRDVSSRINGEQALNQGGNWFIKSLEVDKGGIYYLNIGKLNGLQTVLISISRKHPPSPEAVRKKVEGVHRAAFGGGLYLKIRLREESIDGKNIFPYGFDVFLIDDGTMQVKPTSFVKYR